MRDDFFDFLDDNDPTLSSHDLDSVMKSLQEEISASSSAAANVDLTSSSESSESQPQIGYLLEASDDELGIPPHPNVDSVNPTTELLHVSSDSSGIGELWEFENQIPSYEYDSFDFGGGVEFNNYDNNNNNSNSCNGNNFNDYVGFDGLFDHSDVYYDSAEFTESWRHENETLPAQ